MNKVLTLLVAVFTLWYSPTYAADSKAVKILEDYFKSVTREVKEPFYVYHWFDDLNSKYMNVKNPSSPQGFAYVKAMASLFSMRKNEDSVDRNLYGPGLYTAVDPVASRKYGGESWNLIEIQIPAGMRVLDLNLYEARRAFPKPVSQALTSLGCRDVNSLDDTIHSLGLKNFRRFGRAD